MSKLDGDRATAIYDALEGLQGTVHHLAPETRKAVAGHLARTLPAASAVVAVAAPPTGQTALRDRIRRVLAQVDGFDFDSLEPHDYQIQAAAILAALPAGSEDATTTRADVLREAADAITAVIERDRAYSPRRSNDRAALGGAREIVLGLIDGPLRLAAETQPANLYAQSGIDTTGCDCGHGGMGLRWHSEACAWVVGLLGEARELLAAEGAASAGVQTDEKPVPCSAVALRVHHAPHGWEPQPGMDPVHCGGYPEASRG